MTKAEIRKQYLKKRKDLSNDILPGLNNKILLKTDGWLEKRSVKSAFIYLPIEKNHEVDTRPIIDLFRKKNIQVAVPKSDFNSLSMEAILFESGQSLHINKWHIPEPKQGSVIIPKKLDVVVMPLLAFDERGFRVGYGKGFYDRYLDRCSKDIIKLGLSFFTPISEIKDVGEHDVRMDFCITPDETFDFRVK